jgi:hypothetical protein
LEDAVERVVARDAAAQGEEGAQPLQPHARKLFHVIKALAPAQKRAQGDDQQLDQIMLARAGQARVGHFAQDRDQANDFSFANRMMLKHPASCTHCIYIVHTIL